ncbi:MAG: hypothetical protein ACTSRG_11375 [Candidatus Helarchaeota archaeon]
MLPISRVTLFKTGIGYFERKDKVNMKKKSLNLSFKRKVMNDILATLTISTGNTLVTGISYEGSETDLKRALQDALIKIPQDNSFITLLRQLVGSTVTLSIGSETIEGLVLGVQELEKGFEKIVVNEPYVVLNTKKGIKNIKISDLTGPNSKLALTDEKMRSELQFFIEKMYTSKKKDTKPMTIFFEGEAEDEVIVSYLHEMPSWKTSYRLTFIEDENFLQGWALIDNTLDEDWENIELSLVAGLPISFIYDLYTPNWISRPVVERRDRYDIKVAEFEEELETLADMPKAEAEKPILSVARPPGAPRAGFFDKKKSKRAFKVLAKEKEIDTEEDKAAALHRMESTKVEAKGEEAGDFFEYKIMVPVTVKRNQSSLVPIITTKISGKKLSVYNESVRTDNPMLTCELTNDSGLTLEEGPITVYEMNTFVGEAMLPFIKQGEKRRIPYSVDLGISVTTKRKEKYVDIHEIKLGKDSLYSFQYYLKKCEYLVKNKSEDSREVIIEHPKEHDFKLYDTDKPFEESKNFYRYKVKVDSKTQAKLLIKTRRVDRSSQYFQYVSKESIELWYKQKLINAEEKEFLLVIWKLNAEKNETDTLISELQNKENNIVNDQKRLIENLRSLGTSRSEERLRDKYIAKLDGQEKELENIRNKIKELSKKSQDLQDKINEEIRKRPVVEE